MSKKQNMFTFCYTTLMTFIFLFDVDGVGVGTSALSDVPSIVITIASLLGNIIWLFGIIVMIVLFAMIAALIADRKKYVTLFIERSVEKDPQLIKTNKIINSWGYKLIAVCIGAVYLFGIASGFYFTATTHLALLLFVHIVTMPIIAPAVYQYRKDNNLLTNAEKLLL